MNFFDEHISPDGTLFSNGQRIGLSKTAVAGFDMEEIGSGLDIIIDVRLGDLKILDSETDSCVKVRVEVVEAS